MKIKKETTPGKAESTQQQYITAKENIKYLVEMGTRDKPVLREHLQTATGYTDRQNRAIIEDLRKDGMRICSTAQKGGYWIARTEREYKAFRTEYLSGATKRFKTVEAMDMATEGQVEMEG